MVYIYKRCVNGCGGVFGDFEKIFNEIYSRNNKHKVRFLEKKLASSALGENFLKYHNCEGIVGIDMFKLIQKDYNLGSYKLEFDYSASTSSTASHSLLNFSIQTFFVSSVPASIISL